MLVDKTHMRIKPIKKLAIPEIKFQIPEFRIPEWVSTPLKDFYNSKHFSSVIALGFFIGLLCFFHKISEAHRDYKLVKHIATKIREKKLD